MNRVLEVNESLCFLKSGLSHSRTVPCCARLATPLIDSWYKLDPHPPETLFWNCKTWIRFCYVKSRNTKVEKWQQCTRDGGKSIGGFNKAATASAEAREKTCEKMAKDEQRRAGSTSHIHSKLFLLLLYFTRRKKFKERDLYGDWDKDSIVTILHRNFCTLNRLLSPALLHSILPIFVKIFAFLLLLFLRPLCMVDWMIDVGGTWWCTTGVNIHVATVNKSLVRGKKNR